MAAVLSISAANATDITGVTGNNGVFDIRPGIASGDVGYRHYNNFTLDAGDIANLIYQYKGNGSTKDLNAFINLVESQINVNGIVNTLKGDGSFHNTGHAIFISPNGMTVGASGVLNVGQLSVITPTTTKFDELTRAYNSKDYATMNRVSKLRSDEATAADSTINFGGNAPVSIEGAIISRNGVDIRGSQIDIAGTAKIYNGMNNSAKIGASDNLQTLFDTLVNTEGLTNGSSIIIKSGKGENASIKIASGADILNSAAKSDKGNAEIAITNHGDMGLTFSGKAQSNNRLSLYNTAGDLKIGDENGTGALLTSNTDIAISNASTAGALNIAQKATIDAANDVDVINNGTKALAIGGPLVALNANNRVNIVNDGQGNLSITNLAIIGKADGTTKTVRIVNRGGHLSFAGNANAAESVSIRNEATGGMAIAGNVNAGKGILVHNKNGNATLSGNLKVTDGNIAVRNEGNGKLTTTEDSNIENGIGKIYITNAGTQGMELNGDISNEGELAINNLAGEAFVNGTIENKGNIGIINKDTGTGLTIGATINNEGEIKLVNSTGINGLTVNGTVNNKGKNLYVYNDAGHTTINGKLNNEESGNLYVLSRANSTGITTAVDSVISNETGNLAIKHNGAGTKVVTDEDGTVHNVGMDLNGTVTNNHGEIAINNYTGDMNVAGTITESGNKTIGIVNRAASEDRAGTSNGGNAMTVNATINGHDINIKNNGAGDMTVNGDITHNGRLNVLANEGNLILGGQIHNTGKDLTYAAARANGDGIQVKPTFNAEATNGGDILIKNITGQNGLNYEGTMTNNNGLAEVYNLVGDMTVNGKIDATGHIDKYEKPGASAVILNKGAGLTVTEASQLDGEVVIVNKGTKKADVADKYREKLYE